MVGQLLRNRQIMLFNDPGNERPAKIMRHDLDPDLQGKAAPDRLILPHPRLQDRAFVLVPLADVAADWVHPVLGKSVAQMLADLPAAARAEVHPILP